MGLFSSALKLASKAGGALATAGRAVNKIPLIKAVPVLGTAASVVGGIATASSLLGGGQRSPGLPQLPGGAGLPALPGAGAPPIVGDRGIFQNDPNIIAALQPFAISKTNLRQYYRSPLKGYVIRRDSVGDPYAIPKSMARAYLGWKPSKKPIISVGDWQAVQRADRTVKKMRKVFRTMARVDKSISGGKVVIPGKRKKGGR